MTDANGAAGSLAAALADLQTQLPHVAKDATNPHFKSRYATLDAISAALLPLLGKLGLSFSAKPTLHDGAFVLAYVLRHAPSGESDAGWYPLPTGNPQQIGSAITYARRYALCAVTGLAPDDDDDGNEASSGAGKRAPVAAAGRGLTPTQQRAERQRRTAEEKAVAQARSQDRPMDRGSLPDEDNKWQDTAPRPASPEQKNAIKARLRDTGRSAPDMSGLSYLEAARMITDLAAAPASTGQDTAPEDRPGSVTPGQHKALEALLGQFYGLDSKDRDGRHQAVQQLLSLDAAPASLNDLSYNQAKAARDKIVAVMAEREREAKRAAAGPVRIEYGPGGTLVGNIEPPGGYPEDWPG